MTPTWRLEWKPNAIEGLKVLSVLLKERILTKMAWFVAQDNPLGFAKRLKGTYAGHWRFRVGDYRVICDVINGRVRILRVLSVKNRKDVYKDLR